MTNNTFPTKTVEARVEVPRIIFGLQMGTKVITTTFEAIDWSAVAREDLPRAEGGYAHRYRGSEAYEARMAS